MKYNKLYNNPSRLFIEHYEVVGDKMIIYLGDGKKIEVDYSVEYEKNLLKIISSQLSEGQRILDWVEIKRNNSLTEKILLFSNIFLIGVTAFGIIFAGPVFMTVMVGPALCDVFFMLSQIKYKKISKQMQKSIYIIENLDCLKNYDERLTLINQKNNEQSLDTPEKINQYEEEHVLNALEIYSLKSLRAVIESWEVQKNYGEKDVATFKKNAPELVLENQKVKKLSQKK